MAVRLVSEPHQQVLAVPVDRIQVSSTNPRHDLGNIDELASSIQVHGLLQPIVVRQRARGYDLIAGHRRLAAVRQLGWDTVPALVRRADAEQSDVLQMVENLQRQDLSPAEEADGLAGLMRRYGWSTREVASAIKRSQAYVSKRLRVYEDPVLREAVVEHGLAPSTAEELLTVEPERRRWLIEQALQGGWGVEQVRDAVRSESGSAVRSSRRPAAHYGSVEPRRPPGFTSMLREMRGVLRRILPQDLTEADVRELRLLFQDLAALAKAEPGKREMVFPPIPVLRSPRRSSARGSLRRRTAR